MALKLSEADRKRLERVRRGEMMQPSTVKNLVRRGVIRKITSIAPRESHEWGRVVSRSYAYEIVKDVE